MPRNLTASDRRRLLKMASTMPVGSPERKAILAGLSSMQEAQKSRLRSRRASVTLADRMEHDKQTAKMMGGIIDRAVREWEDALSTLYLDDLSKAYNQIDDFEGIANRMASRIGDIWVSHIDGHGMADFYDEVTDAGHYDLIQAYESAQHELQEMVGEGMADEGNERYVQRRIEEDVLPVLEDAIEQFARDYDPLEAVRKIDYRR